MKVSAGNRGTSFSNDRQVSFTVTGLANNDYSRTADVVMNVPYTRMNETMRLVHDSGGQGFQAALRQQRLIIREANSVAQQIEVKQGWVIGTAKISVAAPWVIVILLASREENSDAYSSIQGSLLLLLGLFASVLAIRLITRIGRVENQTRVFA